MPSSSDVLAQSPEGALATVSGAMRALTAEFRSAGIDTPSVDARLLVLAASGLGREDVLKSPDTLLTKDQQACLKSFRDRRLQHEPVSRILGARDFFGRRFEVTPATLDPRPESELLIETVLDYVCARNLQREPLRILDVGTGSGCLIVTLLAELGHARATATDVSQAALDVAARNAAQYSVSERVKFVCEPNLKSVSGPFDILISNPPYIASKDIAALAPDVARFDPVVALDGGADGLTFFHRLAENVLRLVPHGLGAFEIGSTQAKAVVDIFATQAKGHLRVPIAIHHDLAGHPRCVALQSLSSL